MCEWGLTTNRLVENLGGDGKVLKSVVLMTAQLYTFVKNH